MVHAEGYSTDAATPLRLPQDGGCAGVDHQFVFGPDLLVAPALEEGARRREVYLPAGTTWKDAWTDAVREGGQCIEADAPLERIPLRLRGEAKLPIRGDEN